MAFLILKLQYPHTNSPKYSPYTYCKICEENLLKDQSSFPFKIISLILLTFPIEYVLILLGKKLLVTFRIYCETHKTVNARNIYGMLLWCEK